MLASEVKLNYSGIDCINVTVNYTQEAFFEDNLKDEKNFRR